MVYDEGLAEFIRQQLQDHPGFTEKKMFGGICYLINGNMACGVVKNQLMVRIGKEKYESALQKDHVTEMDFTGKPMRGMIYIDEDGSTSENVLLHWIDEGLNYAKSLPPK